VLLLTPASLPASWSERRVHSNSNRYDGYQAKTKRQIPIVILSPCE